ncbi:amidohydrolase family protein [Rhizobium laguerreae]
MFDTLITNGMVVNASGQLPGYRHSRRTRRGPPCAWRARHGTRLHQCEQQEVLPGLVDAHVHLREPGMTQKEDFESGTHAAALGGVTTILDMPTDDPWTATAQQLSDKMASAAGRIHVDVGFQAVVSRS